MSVQTQSAMQMQQQDPEELSFESVTFGDQDSPTVSDTSDNNNNKKKDSNKKRSTNKKHDQSPRSEPKGTLKHDANAIVVSVDSPGAGGGAMAAGGAHAPRLDVTALLRRLEPCGAVRAYYFRDNQNFGFVQFQDITGVDAAVLLDKTPFADGLILSVDRCSRITPGKDPRTASIGSLDASVLSNSFPGSPMSAGVFAVSPNNSSAAAALLATSPTAATAAAAAAPPVPEKPDNTLVLKNLPFALKQEQLHEILISILATAPQSVNFHYDHNGVFRGMGFIKYRALEDSIKVHDALNGLDIQGRKVRVEYKRKQQQPVPATTKPQDVPAFVGDDEEMWKVWEQLKELSRDSAAVNELGLSPNFTPQQRKLVHMMSDKLRLVHSSVGDGDARQLTVSKPPKLATSQLTPTSPVNSSKSDDSSNGKAIEIKGRRTTPRGTGDRQSFERGGAWEEKSPRGGSSSGQSGSFTSGSPGGEHTRPRSFSHGQRERSSSLTIPSASPAGAGGADVPLGTSPSREPWRKQQDTSGTTVSPVRQPRGPDGTRGFSDAYRALRHVPLPIALPLSHAL